MLSGPDQSCGEFQPLKRIYSSESEGLVAAGVVAVGSLGIAWPFWDPDGGFRIPPSLDYWMEYAVASGVGLLAVIAGCRRLFRIPWLKSPVAEMACAPDGVENGFVFRYVQRARLRLHATVTASLVLRETTRETDSEQKVIVRHCDHLVAAHSREGQRFAMGECLKLSHQFELPNRGAAGLVVMDAALSWVMTVHVTVRGVSEYWYEFLLPLRVSPEQISNKVSDTGYLVRLLRYPGLDSALPFARLPTPLQEAAPHLEGLQVPFTLRENLTREAAEQVCRRLEVAGATVELRRGDDVIPRARMHDLPVPQAVDHCVDPSLPIAASPSREDAPEIEVRQ